jgi:hypothetical protein
MEAVMAQARGVLNALSDDLRRLEAAADAALMSFSPVRREPDAEAAARARLALAAAPPEAMLPLNFEALLEMEAALPAAVRRRGYKFTVRKARTLCILGAICSTNRAREALAHLEEGIATLEALSQPLDEAETGMLQQLHFQAARTCEASGLNDAAAYVHHVRRGVPSGETGNPAAWLRRVAAMSDEELRAKMHDARSWLAPSREEVDASMQEMQQQFEDSLDGTLPRKPRACGACGAVDAPPERKHALCGACRLVAYCGAACQAAHWRGAHKVPCKAARAARKEQA